MADFDVIIVGGGPSGSSCAAFLAKQGRKVLLLDRATFPRDKTCGDGISGRSVAVLNELGLMGAVSKIEHADMYGVTFSSPAGKVVPVAAPKDANGMPPGFVCRREVFDNLLFQNAKKLCAKTIEGFMVTDLLREGDRVVGVRGTSQGKEAEFRAKVVVGADGAGGVVARKLGPVNTDEDHQCAAIRCYYENVEGMRDQIELHFVDGVLPGYFWIFPLPGKRANVGLGMIVSDMKKSKVNLQKAMADVIEKNPVFKDRFAKAKRISEVKSWLLPLASKTPQLKLCGDGYVLIGDAASLIDPFTGEGIGNALTSGKIAARVIGEALDKGDVSEAALSAYPKALWERIGKEVKGNFALQENAKSRWKMNLIIDKASRSKDIQEMISNALINPDSHGKIADPVFLLKALFA